jgi:hypothetical protein
MLAVKRWMFPSSKLFIKVLLRRDISDLTTKLQIYDKGYIKVQKVELWKHWVTLLIPPFQDIHQLQLIFCPSFDIKKILYSSSHSQLVLCTYYNLRTLVNFINILFQIAYNHDKIRSLATVWWHSMAHSVVKKASILCYSHKLLV